MSVEDQPTPQGSDQVDNEYAHLLDPSTEMTGSVEDAAVRPEPEAPVEVPAAQSTEAARVPRSRDELRAIITQRRGEAPTEEQLDHIESAEKQGKWLG